MTPKEQHNFEESMAQVESNLPAIASALYIYFKALVNQGFTEAQAIHIVGVHGTSFGYKEVGK
jgi:hypothetical protein